MPEKGEKKRDKTWVTNNHVCLGRYAQNRKKTPNTHSLSVRDHWDQTSTGRRSRHNKAVGIAEPSQPNIAWKSFFDIREIPPEQKTLKASRSGINNHTGERGEYSRLKQVWRCGGGWGIALHTGSRALRCGRVLTWWRRTGSLRWPQTTFPEEEAGATSAGLTSHIHTHHNHPPPSLILHLFHFPLHPREQHVIPDHAVNHRFPQREDFSIGAWLVDRQFFTTTS